MYQNGVRINEPFGDTVQFDLVPLFALERIQLTAGADPVHGLNALGGSLSLQLKDGFSMEGAQGDVSVGSFGRYGTTGQYGVNSGPWAAYVGATWISDPGWREASPSTVTQAVADVLYRRAALEVDANVVFADTQLTGNGPAPIDLLEVDRHAIFTSPDTTANELHFWQGRFSGALATGVTLGATAYYRSLDRDTLNGDEAHIESCASPAPGGSIHALCTEDGRPLVELTSGRIVTTADGLGDGLLNRTRTRANGYGGSLLLDVARPLAGLENVFAAGIAIDGSDVGFLSASELGSFARDRSVTASGVFLGVLGEAPDDAFNTALDVHSRTNGFYFSNTLSPSDRWHLTMAGRYDSVRSDLVDGLGTSLDGSHLFRRFNPSFGLVFQPIGSVSLYGRYSESSRAPTAAELSCADPAEPCRVPNAFVSDPPLDQAVARAVELGARGRVVMPGARGTLSWSMAAYRSRIADDLLFVASPDLLGSDYFQNAGDPQRAGLDMVVRVEMTRLQWHANYAFLRATFESPIVLASDSEVNSAAAPDGSLQLQSGDRLPGLPAHQLRLNASWALSGHGSIHVDVVLASSQVLRGDETWSRDPLPGYGLLNLRTSYELREGIVLLAGVNNLFDAQYETVGLLADLDLPLEEAPEAHRPVFASPGAPRTLFVGVRVGI